MTYRVFSYAGAGVTWLLAIAMTAGIGHAAAAKALRISVNRTSLREGQSVVVTAVATSAKGSPISGLKIRAFVNGRRWCASQTTLPSGVVHLLLHLPEPGVNIRDGHEYLLHFPRYSDSIRAWLMLLVLGGLGRKG